MFKVTLRGLWAHKRRLLSTVLAIVLGVAFMSGTLVFADTIDAVFEDLFADVNEDVDVQVQGESVVDAGFGGPDARQDLPIELVDEVAGVDGVERAAPYVGVTGSGAANRVLGPDGDALGASSGPPTLLENWIDDDVLNPYTVTTGRGPEADDEVALNLGAAEEADLEVGDSVTVVSQLGRADYEVVGTFTFGEAKSVAGAVSVEFTLAEAQRIAGLEGRTQQVLAAGDGSVDDAELVRRVADALPAGPLEVLTGEEASEQLTDDVQQGFEFFRVLLLVFGTIAVVVGAFIIFNTFSILVAQRTRELALLRAIGAARRQVLLSVFAEAAVVGVVAALVGLGVGVGLALLVTEAFSAAGADLPTTDLVIGSGTIAVAFVIGLGVTLAASVVPAVQATRVPPLAALRDVAVDRAATSRWRVVVGVLLLALGAFNLSAAWRAGGDTDSLPAVGTGALLVLVGAIVVGPVLAAPTVRVLGAGLPRLRGITGRLARENAARSPKRTSATASALLIGVALVGFITTFGSSAQASVRAEVERGFSGDLIVQSSSAFGPGGFPPSVADDVAAVDGVEAVSRVAFTPAQLTYPNGDRSTQFVTALEPRTALDVFVPRMEEGDLADLSADGVVVDVATAEDDDLAIGDVVDITAPSGRTKQLTIQAISDDLTLIGYWAIDIATWTELVTERQLSQLVLTVEDGRDPAAVQVDVEEVVADLPGMDVLDREGFIGDLASQITSFLTLINALLLLSIIIALIGIANTLSLSIHERTRELGLLRAVGMTRSQLRSSVRWEAVIIAVLGTLVGIGLGLLASWALVTALGELGLGTFSVPFGTLAVVVVAAAVLGVLASIRPARRAARLDVLDAIAAD